MEFFAILVILVITVSGFPTDISEGDTCRTPEGKGVCQRIKNCPEAIQQVKMGKKPVKCGFIRKEIVVCCVKTKVSQEQCKEFRKIYHPDLSNKILNGNITKELPHMAAIGYFRKGRGEKFNLLCSGTLISDQFVMTAAHCLNYKYEPEVVYLGYTISQLENNIDGFIDIDKDNMHAHPSYNMSYHDIALLKLTVKVYPTELMVPACLYTMQDDPDGPLMVAGWGTTNVLGTKSSPDVLIGKIQSVQSSKCEESYRSMFPSGINSSLICAGDPKGITDTCFGDSGGPLLLKEKTGYYTVFGITSMGKMPCGTPYSVYTRVSTYIDWIESVVWPSA